MEPFINHTGRAVPLRRSDVDTDQIIPSDWLKRVERTGFGAGLFSEWREDPTFVLNQERYAGSSVLVAGENFGTGSSREHAVWALTDFGFRVVVSTRFADIFRSNALQGGLLPVQLSVEAVEALMCAVEIDPLLAVTVDLPSRQLRAGDLVADFPLDDFTRWRLMEGLDDIGLTLRQEAEIATYEGNRATRFPATSSGS